MLILTPQRPVILRHAALLCTGRLRFEAATPRVKDWHSSSRTTTKKLGARVWHSSVG